MAADKLLKLGTTGFPEEYIPVQSSAGVADANKAIALDATGKLDVTFLPPGLGDSLTLTAGENLSAGNFIYITGAGLMMKADANAIGKAAVGFVLAAVLNTATGVAYFAGQNTALSGLTPGSMYFLSDNATGTAQLIGALAGGANHIVQPVGRAISANTINFEAEVPVIKAS